MSTVVYPLRQVATCNPTGRVGKEIGPHQFWLATEYALRLSCGHELILVRNVYLDATSDQVRDGLTARRYRCRECAPHQSTAKRGQPSHPDRDPLAVRLAQISMVIAADDDVDQVLDWTRQHLEWIPDGRTRSHAYGAVALTLINHFHDAADLPQVTAVREHLNAWLSSGAEDDLVAAKRAARGAYSAQHKSASWFAVRGVIAASAIVPARGGASAAKLVEALEWNEPAKKARLDTALAARRQAEILALLGVAVDAELEVIRNAVGAPVGVTIYSAALLAQLRASYADAGRIG